MIEDLAPREDAVLTGIANNVVCGRVTEPCTPTALHVFAANELPFNPEVQGNPQSADSLPLFAVILETQTSTPDDADPMSGKPPTRPCGGFFPEVDRLDAQQHFGDKRVFASRHGCGDSRVVYAGISPTENVLAVFAGDTEAEARATLEAAKTRWSTAKLVRTHVRLITFN